MPQNRSYEESNAKDKESPLTEFLGGMFMGGFGFPMTYGWVLPLSWPIIFAIGGVIGAYIGGDMAWSSIKRIRQKRTVAN